MVGVGVGDSGESWTQASPVLSHPTYQLLEFDSTNTSDVAATPPGKPYPPYSLAEFSWNNISDSLDPATLSATFRGHPSHDPTRAFANGSLAFRVRAWVMRVGVSDGGGLQGQASTCFPSPPGFLPPRCRPSPGPAGQPSRLASCTPWTPASWRWPWWGPLPEETAPCLGWRWPPWARALTAPRCRSSTPSTTNMHLLSSRSGSQWRDR